MRGLPATPVLLVAAGPPPEHRLAQLQLSPGFAPLRRGPRRGLSGLELEANEQRLSTERLQLVAQSTSRSLLLEGISTGEMHGSKLVCC